MFVLKSSSFWVCCDKLLTSICNKFEWKLELNFVETATEFTDVTLAYDDCQMFEAHNRVLVLGGAVMWRVFTAQGQLIN